jgi:hypothetical protein
VNEPSYFAWAAGEAALFAPHRRGRSPELKRQLARAAIAGAEAVWQACPGAEIVSVDSMCHVTAARDERHRDGEVRAFNQGVVFESWDMIAGRLAPELGGTRRHLGVPGINYYWTNQWELGQVGIPLADDDERRVPLSDIVRAVAERYEGPVLITETSHVDDARAGWVRDLACAAEELLADGTPLAGICLYPILGMPEWHAPSVWTRMGLWDLERRDGILDRVIHRAMLGSLRDAQRVDGRWQSLARAALGFAGSTGNRLVANLGGGRR